MKKTMDHAAYQKKVKGMHDEELDFVMLDAYEAAQADPDGINAGYYWDEYHYCAMEKARRLKALMGKPVSAARLGEYLASFLMLEKNSKGRYDTTWGDKTAIGLYRSAKRIIEGDIPKP